ncbi:MAG: MoxR family ATPase [Phycisphaeraceae bacterium]|nr:MoxR family ATPase [Phycisphaerae bacterium]MBX3393258.1 MoxR family ATPase [Phycisphaeraceae bacterium]HRJ50398.1 MoxR family ATPase [Phycisphaerales bacterium]
MSSQHGEATAPATTAEVKEQCEQFRRTFQALRDEIGKVIVGHSDAVEGVLIALFAGGNVLLEGVPGLGKTLLVRTLAQTLSLPFSRIQFTPDLMPADVVGTNIVTEDPQTGRRQFEFQRGPIFAQVVLADEINRATPKTQSALLEAMQERSVTSGGTTYRLELPFLVLATQNPIEQEGTYPLPEAQMDRFIFKINVGYSQLDDLMTILDRTTGTATPEPAKVLDGPRILSLQSLVRGVVVAPHVKQYVARLVLATHPGSATAAGGPSGVTNRYVRCGSSPRGAQALLLGAKVKALVDGRYHVSYGDIKAIATMALRHRLILNFEAEADRIDPDDLVAKIMQLNPSDPPRVGAV